MSGFVPQVGSTYTSGASQLAVTQTSHQNSATSLTLTKDEVASAGALPIFSITFNSETLDQLVQVTFGTITESAIATVYDVNLSTGLGPFNHVQAVLLGTDGANNVLVASASLTAAALVVSQSAQTFGDSLSDTFTAAFTPACFASGTRIATAEGEVAVEALREDQHVVTAQGQTVPIVWLGHRTTHWRNHSRPQEARPVRIAAGAFGTGQPARDLVLSPDHAVFTDGVLIPARHLVNGSTVAQQDIDEITYWHVELPTHGVVLAEGLACESYLDTGNRSAFDSREHRFDVQSYTIRVSA